MRNPWINYRTWLEQRRKNRLQWWERKRAGGRLRYVLWIAVWWGGWMVAVTSLIDYFRGSFEVGELVFKIIYYPLCGWLIGLVAWWDNERKYQDSPRVNLDTNASTK